MCPGVDISRFPVEYTNTFFQSQCQSTETLAQSTHSKHYIQQARKECFDLEIDFYMLSCNTLLQIFTTYNREPVKIYAGLLFLYIHSMRLSVTTNVLGGQKCHFKTNTDSSPDSNRAE